MLAQRALEGAESQDLLPQATALVARILDVPLSAVLAWEPREHTLRVTAGVGWRAGVVGRALVDTSGAPETSAAWSGLDPVVFEKLDREPRMATLPLLRGHEVASGLSVAIVPRGRPYGVLAAYTERRRRFHPAEISSSVASRVCSRSRPGVHREADQRLQRTEVPTRALADAARWPRPSDHARR
jgi:GAF domain-containing protein